MKYSIYLISILIFCTQVKSSALERPVPDETALRIAQVAESGNLRPFFFPAHSDWHTLTAFYHHRNPQTEENIARAESIEPTNLLSSNKTQKNQSNYPAWLTRKNCTRALLVGALITAACFSYHEPLHKRFFAPPKPTDLAIPLGRGFPGAVTRVFGLDDMLIGGVALHSIIAVCEPLMLIGATLFTGWKIRKWVYGEMLSKKELKDAVKKIEDARKEDNKKNDLRFADQDKQMLGMKKNMTATITAIEEIKHALTVQATEEIKARQEISADLKTLQHGLADFEHTQAPINALISKIDHLIAERLLPATCNILKNDRAFQTLLAQNESIIQVAQKIIRGQTITPNESIILLTAKKAATALTSAPEKRSAADEDSKYPDTDPTEQTMTELQAMLAEESDITPNQTAEIQDQKKSWFRWKPWRKKDLGK